MSGLDPNGGGPLVVPGGGASLPVADAAGAVPVSSAAGTSYTATDLATACAAIGITATPRALNSPISVVSASDTSPAVGSGGVAWKNGNVSSFSGGVPAGATYAIVWITYVLAGTTGLSVTIDRLFVDAGTNWNFTFYWLNGSGSTQGDGAAEVHFKIYWY